MAKEVIHSTGRLSDRQIVALIDNISSEFNTDNHTFYYGSISTNINSIREIINKAPSYVIDRAECRIEQGKLTVRYARGVSTINPQSGSLSIDVRLPSPYMDEIIVIPTENYNGVPERPNIAEAAKLESLIRKHLILKQPSEIDAAGGSAIDLLQKEMSGLADLHAKMMHDTLALKEKLDKDRDEKFAELNEREKQLNAEIIQKRQDAENEILLRKLEIEAKQKELDDRDHMHVRRALRGQITVEIQNRVKGALLSNRSRALGWSVLALTIICAFVSGLFSYLSYEAFLTALVAKA